MRDYALGTTFDIKFTSRNRDTSTPDLLAGSPAVAAYPDNSTTPITAGITLTTSFDSVDLGSPGLNNIRVVATSGNGYAAGVNYALVLTNGSIDGAVVIGEVVGEFSIEAQSPLRPTVAGRTLDVDAAGDINPVVVADLPAAAVDPVIYADSADALLARNIAGGSYVGRSVSEALYVLRNRVIVSALGVVTVYLEDDVTPSWSGNATRTAGANPITEVDPT